MARCLSIRLSVRDVEVFRGHIRWSSAVNFACGILSRGIMSGILAYRRETFVASHDLCRFLKTFLQLHVWSHA